MTTRSSLPVAIIGVTGYEGISLAGLLARHPTFRLVAATARATQGARLAEALPFLTGSPIADLVIGNDPGDAEVVFVATPHGPAAEIAARCRSEGRRVIDISADFRLPDPALYARWYGHAHPAPDLLPTAVYGLCEWRREAVRAADLVANPGCFPTAALLALAPLLAEGLIAPDVIVDAKTGITGAGRSPARRTQFSEIHDSVTAYGMTGHRHLPEMEGQLAALAPESPPARVTFIPHLVPMNRGILATCYATLAPGAEANAIHAAFAQYYTSEPFVQMIDQPPETGWVRGTNTCLIHVVTHGERVIVLAALDNLMKGGAGQAVQNANLMVGLPETAGLAAAGVWP